MTELEKANKLLPIIQAIAEGKKIQYSFNRVTWFDKDEDLDLVTVCEDIISDSTDYRIKPEEMSITFLPNESCYKCGKKLTIENMASIMLLSNPPKYICKKCAGEEPEENHTIEQNKEKHYRPFEEVAELMLEYQNRFHVNNYCIEEPLIWVKKKVCSGDERSLITAYDINCVFIQDIWIDLTELFEKYTFLDGSVCGVENEIQI